MPASDMTRTAAKATAAAPIAAHGHKATSAVPATFFTLAATWYWVSERDRMIELLSAIAPESKREKARQTYLAIDRRLGSYTRLKFLMVVIVGAVLDAGFYLVGLNYWLLVGGFVGLVEVVPVIGPLIGAILVVAPDGEIGRPVAAGDTRFRLGRGPALRRLRRDLGDSRHIGGCDTDRRLRSRSRAARRDATTRTPRARRAARSELSIAGFAQRVGDLAGARDARREQAGPNASPLGRNACAALPDRQRGDHRRQLRGLVVLRATASADREISASAQRPHRCPAAWPPP